MSGRNLLSLNVINNHGRCFSVYSTNTVANKSNYKKNKSNLAFRASLGNNGYGFIPGFLTNFGSNALISNKFTNRPTSVPKTNINVLILRDSTDNLAAGLQSARTALGMTQTLTITNTLWTSSTTGSNLSSFDVVILVYGSGITYNAALGTNLNTFVSNGGHVIMGSFLWGNIGRITNFNYTTGSTYNYDGNMDLFNTNNVTYNSVHPITTGITATTGVTQANIVPGALTSGSTTIATFTNASRPFIAIKDTGTSRQVGFNLYINYAYASFPRLSQYVCRAVYWCMNML